MSVDDFDKGLTIAQPGLPLVQPPMTVLAHHLDPKPVPLILDFHTSRYQFFYRSVFTIMP